MCHKDQFTTCCTASILCTSYFLILVTLIGCFIFFGKLILTPATESEIEIQPTKFQYYLRDESSQNLSREHVQNLPKRPTSAYFYIHGFQSPNLEEAESIKVKDAILEIVKDIDLVILVDWCEESLGLFTYPNVATFTVPQVAEHVKNEIKWIEVHLSIPRRQIKMAGHSLGAHIMGRSGELLQKDGGGRVGQMTGLDPAGPLFDDVFPGDEHRLSKNDANYVLCIHTDDTLGTTNRTYCHAHLYPTEEVCWVGGFCCRHNSAKELFIGYLHNCPGLRDEELEIGWWGWTIRGLLQGHFRNVTIACIYSCWIAILYAVWFVCLWGTGISIFCCCVFPFYCLMIYVCYNKTDEPKGSRGVGRGGGGNAARNYTQTATSEV